jgi:hypothetical protein
MASDSAKSSVASTPVRSPEKSANKLKPLADVAKDGDPGKSTNRSDDQFSYKNSQEKKVDDLPKSLKLIEYK